MYNYFRCHVLQDSSVVGNTYITMYVLYSCIYTLDTLVCNTNIFARLLLVSSFNDVIKQMTVRISTTFLRGLQSKHMTTP